MGGVGWGGVGKRIKRDSYMVLSELKVPWCTQKELPGTNMDNQTNRAY
jgi:hypothetical protein